MTTKQLTKANEIAILNNAMIELGDDSYIGPWLRHVSYEIEAMMASDLAPDIRIKDTTEYASSVRATADSFAKSTVESAQREAVRIVELAREEAKAIRNHARSQLEKALNGLS